MSGHNQFELLRQRRFAPFFLTQSLGAFNDNVFRNATLALVAFQMGLDGAQVLWYTNFAPALFILPFFLFSATAGQLAEKYEKTRIIRAVKVFEIAVMSIAAIGFLGHMPALLMVVLFLMGLHSTVFGPIKYSILPQALHPQELVGGNGLVETGTALAILFGMMLGGWVMGFSIGPVLASIAVVAIALAGYAASRAIPLAPATSPGLKINFNPLTETWRTVRLCTQQQAVFNSVLGISWFWFFGTALTAQLPDYARDYLGGGLSLNLLALGVFSVGTGIGSLLCEKLSGRTVEIGLVPLGALGISAAAIDLYFAHPGSAMVRELDVAGFLAQHGSWRVLLDLGLVGMFGGFFLVPLYALVQNRTPRGQLSRVIAGNNILNAAFIVAASVFGWASQQTGFHVFGHWLPMPALTVPQVFLVIGLLNALVAIYIFTLVPEFLMRFLSWLVIKTLYRLRVEGIENLPDEGPALIVCNHVSYIDALLIGGAVPRPARFVMYYRIFRTFGFAWMFKAAKAIPIAGAKEDPALMEKAFDDVDAALADGQLVCIFPEGALTRDGEVAKFRGGVERILARRPVPVVPMALRGMWASIWSRRGSRLRLLRIPGRLRAHVGLVVGPPIAAADASAAALEAIVKGLRGDNP